jgi:hypothetical protein
MSENGDWYLCARCRKCGQPIRLMGPLVPNASVNSDDTFVFRDMPCPQCGQVQDCPLSEAVRLQEE